MAKIIQIHQDRKAAEPVRKTVSEMMTDWYRFYNPYGSREEYESRKRRFLDAQVSLVERLGIDREKLDEHDNNLHDVTVPLPDFDKVEVTDDDRPKELVSLTRLSLRYPRYAQPWRDRIFGNVLAEKSEVTVYHPQDCDLIRKQRSMQRWFLSDRVFAIMGVAVLDSDMLTAYFLRESSLSPEERARISDKAFEMYDALEFSRIHYGKRNYWNPLGTLLDELISIIARVTPERLPGVIVEGVSGGLVIDDPCLSNGLYVHHNGEEDLVLTNCTEKYHGDLLREGDRIRYFKHMHQTGQSMSKWNDTGELVAVLH